MAEAHRIRRAQDDRAGSGLTDRTVGSLGAVNPPIARTEDAARPIGRTKNAARPIGVFDSGVGGLSVLNALQAEMPHERFVYFADTAHAPYGERGDDHVAARTRAVTRHLIDVYGIKAMVVACNTATAAAIHLLRADHAMLPLVGVEPALKPAVKISRTRCIAVLATRSTLASAKFKALHSSLAGQAAFSLVPCDGLAAAIEANDGAAIASLCARYTGAAGTFGSDAGQLDTLVLGCTHYPFVTEQLRADTGAAVHFIDTGTPVAQQTRRLMAASDQLADDAEHGEHAPGPALLLTSGSPLQLDEAASRWLLGPAARAFFSSVAASAVA
ncbi:MAG: glutamate racemase [Variovorax sp.]|nr:glutamate racemase [Variovorax sp.]